MLRSRRFVALITTRHTVEMLVRDRRSLTGLWPTASWRISCLCLGIVLSLVSCAPTTDSGVESGDLPLVELASFQPHQVTTDVISVPEQIGLGRVGYGWWREQDPASGEEYLKLAESVGVLELFAADADLRAIDLEIGGSASRERPPGIQIRFNGKRIRTIPLPVEWTSINVGIPSELVRQGSNQLELVQRVPKQHRGRDDQPRLRLRKARFVSGSGREIWPRRPDEIRSQDETGIIEMPVASYLDVVFEIPVSGARLQADFQFAAHPRKSPKPVFLYVQVLESGARETTPLHQRFYQSFSRPRALAVDLAEWSGRTVRLRLGATGSGNGVFRFVNLRISAPVPVTLPTSLPPIPRRPSPRTGTLDQPDVVVILLDAARADAFSPWGGPVFSPSLERLAREAAVFTNAASPSSWTGQSIPAVLTGLFPDSLRIGGLGSRLPDEVPTLAEMLHESGYRTVLWTQHPLYRNHESFRRGFEEFHCSPPGNYQILPAAEQLLDGSRPTFAFVHLIPPHAPYEPPPPFRGSRSNWYQGKLSVDVEHLNSYPRRRDPASLPADDLRYAFDRYLENAAFADHLVGRIVRTLEAAGRYDETLVIVISDHGEAFAEHGRFLHTRTVHREMLHVPFLIKWPRSTKQADSRLSQPVSLVDLAPTLVDLLGLDGAELGFQGRSLAAVMQGQPIPDRPLYALTRGDHDRHRRSGDELMLQTAEWRLLWSPGKEWRRLYRIDSDPAETEDLAGEHPLVALRLRQAALAQRHANRHLLTNTQGAEEVEEIDPEVKAELEALGYVD